MSQVELTATPATTALITGDELLAMGDIGPCELVAGMLVRRSPAIVDHGAAAVNIGSVVAAFSKSRGLGKTAIGGVGVYTRRNPDTVRSADLLFISGERYAQNKYPGGFLDVAPDLIVEIMSPDDRWSEIVQKLREYFSIGVRLVWVADPATHTVYAYRSITDVREFGEQVDLPGDDVLPDLSVSVASLFAE